LLLADRASYRTHPTLTVHNPRSAHMTRPEDPAGGEVADAITLPRAPHDGEQRARPIEMRRKSNRSLRGR
jgi:hypothetical protein